MTHDAVTRLDVSGLPPPEPMEQILETLAGLAPHAQLRVLIDRDPLPLYRILERYGYRHAITPRADGRFDLVIGKR